MHQILTSTFVMIPGRHKQEDRCKLRSHQQLHQGEPRHLQALEACGLRATWLAIIALMQHSLHQTVLYTDPCPPVVANTFVNRDTAPACLACTTVALVCKF